MKFLKQKKSSTVNIICSNYQLHLNTGASHNRERNMETASIHKKNIFSTGVCFFFFFFFCLSDF